jgi:hypothetical protein
MGRPLNAINEIINGYFRYYSHIKRARIDNGSFGESLGLILTEINKTMLKHGSFSQNFLTSVISVILREKRGDWSSE